MTPGVIAIVVAIIGAAGIVAAAIWTGVAADRAKKRDIEAGATNRVLGIYDRAIAELQRQVGDLQSERHADARWKHVAVAHILELHRFIQQRIPGAATPPVPPELAADLPFGQQPG